MTHTNDIFLTGTSGFIGSHLKRALELNGDNVYSGNGAFKAGKWSHVIHLAACNDIRNHFNPTLIESNIVYAKEILTTKYRTIFASSTSAREMLNPYALSKLYGEHLCSQHPNALALRLFNVYGYGCRRGIVKGLIEAAINGTEIEIQNGAQIRDFIYIDDVVQLIVQRLDEPTGIIDIGTGHGTSINDLIAMIEKLIGPIKTKRTKLDTTHQQAFSIAETMPSYNYTRLEDGLREVVKKYKG